MSGKPDPIREEPPELVMFSQFNNVNGYKRSYEAIRCVECNGIMKVPEDVAEFKCPHCGLINKFVFEESSS